jgi:enoyl-CoA hydratase
LPRIVGLGRAKELILLGERIGAEEAHRIGLLNRLVGSDEEVMGEAVRLARRAAQRSPMAVRLAKLALQVGQGVDVDTAMAFESAAQAVCFESDDKHQRMERFLSRKP